MDHRLTEKTNTSIFLHEYPLTRGQAALWFHYKLAPDSVAYNLAGAVTFPRDTKLEAFQRAFQKLAERHPMLRTFFAEQHGDPVQRVYPSIEIPFQSVDASGWNTVQLDDVLAKEVYRPFDLEHGPTWRVVVFKQAPASKETNDVDEARGNLTLLTLHHIIGDLWTIAIILSEVTALYREETNCVPARLKPLRTSYADHVQKERDQLAGPQAEMSWDYWSTVLSGERSTLSLPGDRSRPSVSTGQGAVHSLLLDKKLTGALHTLAEDQHVALHTVLLTAFQTLLHRYTGQNDILVGFPKAGRSPGMARVVGYFVNQMVIRSNFTENPRFKDLLNGIHKSVEEGAKHDWYPFSLLVQRLQPVRDLSRSPLIQAVFSWQQAPSVIPRENAGAVVLGKADHTFELNGLVLRSFSLACRVAPFDVSMLAAEMSDGLAVTIEYATDLFDPETISRMAACYLTLLESIVANPEQRVSDLTMLPKPERDRLVEAWNATAAVYPDKSCLHQLFEQQAERTPEITAVVSGEKQLTYHQLNQRANQLAHFLQKQGVGPDCLVGVCLEPSTQMIIALLGILKAGGAYVPLDPNIPEKRLSSLVADARPTLLLTRQGLRPRLRDFSGKLFFLDAEIDRLRRQPQTNPSSPATPDQLAYVMYTSGSTGTPKGIALAHRGVVNLLADFQNRQAIQPGDACSWWTSPGFDVSVYEIFSPLLAGGSLQVIPEDLRLEAHRLLDWIQEHTIRSAFIPPFLLNDFANWVQHHPGITRLRRLLVGVEPIPEALLSHLNELVPDLCILNGYGPTETTICSTIFIVDAAHPHAGNTPIGRPVANTHIYLLDRSMQPVPMGVVGEIYIGGVGLARGYLNQPELTSQCFIRSPFRSGEYLYSTGDLARYLPDGNLIFVGRKDTQVKINGLRIELGEIEANLTQHPLVNGAVVLLYEPPFSRKHLVAYVTHTEDTPPSSEELRRFLNQRLPRTMVPSTFVIMEAFPLTSTGKLDRKALPIPQHLQPEQANTYRAPQTNTEQILVSIWQQVLGVDPIGVDDNFFELGGDSIMSLQIVARSAEAGLHLRLKHVFQVPTIAGLAALADLAEAPEKQKEETNINGVIPLTPIQYWFFEQNIPNPHHWNQSLMFTTSQRLNPVHLGSALSDILMRHDTLHFRYTNGSLGWQQTSTDSDEEVPFEVIDLSGSSEAERSSAIEMHAATQQRSLHLSTGPLIRAVYFDFGTDRPGRLLIVIHHLAVDAISWRILIEELESAYQRHERGLLTQLPARTTDFATWAKQLSNYARSSELIKEAGFWFGKDWATLQALPSDLLPSKRGSVNLNTEASAQSVSVSLGREETQALLQEAPAVYGSEINDILLAGLTQTFHRWTGSSSLWIDLEGHGREDIFEGVDLTRTVGWFTTLYPVHLELPLDADPVQVIKIINEQLRQIPRHGLAYGLLRYLCPDPVLSDQLKAIPPAPVSFNYLGQLPEANMHGILTSMAPEPLGEQRCPEAQRSHLIEINAAINQGELHIDWIYSSHIHSKETMDWVAGIYIDELRTLIAYSHSQKEVGYTPLDFPGADLSQAELDTISTVYPSNWNLEAIYPSSPMQQGMIFYTLYAPDTGVYFEQLISTTQGEFDYSAFERAWQRILDRHSILRTSFVWQGLDRMLQIVHKDVKAPLEFEDWRDIPAAEQPARLDGLVRAERGRGFELSSPPLLRLKIIRIADDTHHFLLNYHHALLDGWSIPLLFKEVFAFYDVFTRHQDLALPPARPYRDFINWLNSRDLTAAEAFWRRELEGFVPFSWLPALNSLSPPAGASMPAELDERLSMPTTSALRTLARKLHLTINTLIQGAWAILWSRYLQRDEVVFGVVFAGRSTDLPGAESMIGLFINTLPLRVRISPQSELIEWLKHIQDKVIEIQQYDYSPLMKVLSWSGLPRSLPLFDAILVFENYPTQPVVNLQTNGLRIVNISSYEQTNYPLTVAITPGEQLDLKILYDPNRFDPAIIQNLLDHLRQVLGNMVAEPSRYLSSVLPAVTSGLVQASENWSIRTTDYPVQASLPKMSEQHVERGPLNKAVALDGGSVYEGTPLENFLAQLWERLLKIDRVGIHDNFFDLGGDSLLGAICIQQLQDNMQETIPLSAIFEVPTVFELARYLDQKFPAGVARLLGTSAPISLAEEVAVIRSTLVPIQPEGSKPPLFCVHPAGGIVFPYYTLIPYLGKDQPLYGIQDTSLYDAQSAPTSIEAMATDYLKALKTVQPDGPYHFLGWSVGGVIAYEMAQQLSRQGQSVALLIMLDTPAPAPARTPQSRISPTKVLQQGRSWIQVLPNRILQVGAAILPIVSYIRSGLFLLTTSVKQSRTRSNRIPTIDNLLGWAGFDTWRSRLLREADVANIVSQHDSLLLVEMPEVRRILELVREHRRLARRYATKPYQGQIILFRAVPPQQSDRAGDPRMGWGELAQRGVEVHTIQANHVALLVKPYVEVLARELKACLDQSSKPSRG
jgi:amino acid adenylation domain-containing protein/non-ribosomal peptide synthase protein (TIGR01720 family)